MRLVATVAAGLAIAACGGTLPPAAIPQTTAVASTITSAAPADDALLAAVCAEQSPGSVAVVMVDADNAAEAVCAKGAGDTPKVALKGHAEGQTCPAAQVAFDRGDSHWWCATVTSATPIPATMKVLLKGLKIADYCARHGFGQHASSPDNDPHRWQCTP